MKLGDKQDKKVSPLTTENVLGASRLGKSSVIDTPPQTMAEVLGSIYDLLSKIQNYEKLQSELDLVDYKLAYMEEQDRNKKILEALGSKKPKRRKKAKEVKQEKEIEKEKTKPENKAPPEKAPPPTAEKAPLKTPTPPTAAPTAPAAPSLAVPTAARVVTGAVLAGTSIGALSAKFESNKEGPAAVGYDSTGGTSYGTYQMASKYGVPQKFIGFLSKTHPDWAQTLTSAGKADTGSTKGDFPDAWKSIAKQNPKEFGEAQHNFIQQESYDPAVKSIGKLGYDVNQQPAAIKDVVWSTAVQHGAGGATSIFKKALELSGGPNAKSEIIIKNVYDIRRTKFGSSTEAVRAGVNKRFDTESQMALQMLNQDGNKINNISNENKNLKADAVAANQEKPPIIVNNNKTSTTQTPSSGSSGGSDDTNAYERKLKG
jgi:hypothetical protein